jgi:hypothetical protein
MKFLMLFTPANKTAAPTQEAMAAMGAYIEKSLKDGVLVWTEGLAPGQKGARVERAGGEVTVKDGPYSEAKEVIGGFALINAKSMDDAIAHAREFLGVAGDGVTEIHRVADASDFAPEVFTPEEQAREAKWRQQMQANAGK